MEKVKITSKGQITLPKRLRDKLKVGEGDYLEAFLRGNELIFRPLPGQTGKEVILDYCKEHSASRVKVTEVKQILARLPFSLSERVRTEREENSRDG
jgi:AbrB family looped-hinge helix DNA binding protein